MQISVQLTYTNMHIYKLKCEKINYDKYNIKYKYIRIENINYCCNLFNFVSIDSLFTVSFTIDYIASVQYYK